MRKHYLSFLSLAFAAVIVLGGHAVLKAQQTTSSAVKAGRWSDASTWSDKKVPAEGALVTIRLHNREIQSVEIEGVVSDEH